MLGSAYGDANASIASRIVAAIAHENSSLAHFSDKRLVQWTEFGQYEICLADPIWDSVAGKLDHQPPASLHRLMYIPLHESAIGNRGGQAGKGHGVHVVWRTYLSHHFHLVLVACEHPNPQTGQTIGLGKCPGNKQVRQTRG